MVMDPMSLAVNVNNRTDRLAYANLDNETHSRATHTEAGQTSGSDPAAVVEISAAALETSRAVNAPTQTADPNQTEDVPHAASVRPETTPPPEEVRVEDQQSAAKYQPPPSAPGQSAPSPGEEPRASRVDLVA